MASLLSFAKGVERQLNPFDNGATYSNPTPQRTAPAPPSLIHQVGSLVNNNIAKPLGQFPVDASNQIYNHVVAPTLNLPHLTVQQSPIRGIAQKVGATGSLHQTIGSGLQTALIIGSGGLARGLEAATTGLAGFVAPKLATQAALKTTLGLGERAVPKLATRILPGAIARGQIAGGYNAAAATGNGATLPQAGKAYGQGVALGTALPLAGEGLKAGGKVLSNATSIKPVHADFTPSENKAKPSAPKVPDVPLNKANKGGNMLANGAQAYARAFGITPEQASKELTAKSSIATGLPVKPISREITTGDKVMANTMGTTPEQERASRIAKQQRAATKALKNIPTPTRVLPDAPKVTGNLKEMQSPNSVKQFFASKVTAVRNLGTPSANKLADTLQNVDKTQQDLQAKYMYNMPTAQKLGKSDFSHMVDVVEGKAKPNSQKIAQAAKETRTALRQVNKDAFAQGTLIGSRRNYFPHSYDFKAIKKNPGQYDAALQHLIDTNQAHNPEEAIQLFDKQARQNDLWGKQQGNLENARQTSMPGYAKTKDALNQYIGSSSARIAQATHLGTDNQLARRLVGRIRLEGGNADTAAKAVEQYLRPPDKGLTTTSKVMSGLRGGLGAAQLGKAVISHAGQTSNTAVDARITNTLKGWGKFLGQSSESKDFLAKTGVTNPQTLHSYQNQFTSVRGALSKVTAPGLNQMMKVNRSVTALAYRAYGNALAKEGNAAELRKLGVEGDIGKTLTPAQEIQAARGGVNRTMFNSTRAATPINAETVAGKAIGQYRLAYAYKQTGFIYNQVLKEAGRGNLAPLARFLAVSAPIAGGTIALKNKISGNSEGIGGIAMDTAGALGGIPGEAALQLARYGKRNLPGTVAGLVAPMAGTALTVLSNGQKALNGNAKPLGKEALGLLPVAGSRVSKAVFPSATTSPTSSGSTASPTSAQGTAQVKTDSATQLKAFKAAASASGYGLNKLPDGRYVYSINGKVSTTQNLTTAQHAINEDALKNSSQNIKQVGNTVYQKTATGTVTATPLIKYQNSLGAATLTAQKSAGNLSGWLTTAQAQLQNIATQLKDPNTTPLEALTLQNQASTLQSDMAKYSSYGGFTKGTSSGSRGSGGSRSATAKTPNYKTAKAKAISAPRGVKVSKPRAFKASAPKKLSVSKIPSNFRSKKLA